MPLQRTRMTDHFGTASDKCSVRACITLVLVLLIALIARILDAAPTHTQVAKQDSIEPVAPVRERSTSAIFSRDFPTIIAMGPGLAFLDDKTGWSFNINGASQFNVDMPVFYGFDAAVNIWRPSETDSQTGIQLLPTAYFLFEVLNSREIYPYIGMSFGPMVKVRRLGVGEKADTKTDLNLMLLFRSGIAVSLASNAWFHFEPKFGLLAGKMIFLPQMTAAFLF